MCDGRDGVFGCRWCWKDRHYRHAPSRIMFCGVKAAFLAALVLSADWVGSQTCAIGTRAPLGERKTRLRVAVLLAELTKLLLRYFRRK